jgi:hypothetical protein
MVGVSGVFLGSAVDPVPLRGIPGGGLPWVITRGDARLKGDGRLRIEVEGVEIDPQDTTAKQMGVGGTNPVPRFFATLSCLDAATGNAINLNTSTVEASAQGVATIKERLDLSVIPPAACVAPLIFVRGDLASIPGNPFANPEGPDPTDPWFVVAGF